MPFQGVVFALQVMLALVASSVHAAAYCFAGFAQTSYVALASQGRS